MAPSRLPAISSAVFPLPGAHGGRQFDAYVSPGCQLNVLDPRGVPVDPVHSRFIARWVKSDSVVWDVGGNIGLFAIPAALKSRQSQVNSFEPDFDLIGANFVIA